jgi:hypothetical protein
MKPQDLQTLAAAALMPAGFRRHDSGEPARPAAVTAASALAAKVDELGALRSIIADLQTHADHIRAELEEAGLKTLKASITAPASHRSKAAPLPIGRLSRPNSNQAAS